MIGREIHYMTGIEEIDKEHLELIKVHALMLDDINNFVDITKNLKIFSDLTIKHFINEETYMEKINFPYIEFHKKAHNSIKIKLYKMLTNIPCTDLMDKYFIKDLENILFDHIDHFDFQIKEFIKNKQL